MRNILKGFTAVAVATSMAACAPDNDVETFEAEETAVPEYEAPATPETDFASPLFTSDFEATDAATGAEEVTGEVRVFRLDPAMGQTAQPAQPTTDPDQPVTEPADPAIETDVAAAGEGFRLEVMLNGLSQGEHAWHIHSGSCDEQAPVAVAITPTADMEGIGQPLNVTSANATAQASVEVPGDQLTVEQLESGEYSLNVHERGGTDHGPAVACADLDDGIM